ncbi:MAG: MFS transporter [Planctomycetales bacterium]|nr:MFS transporter [Planctomycetales bacterium]
MDAPSTHHSSVRFRVTRLLALAAAIAYLSRNSLAVAESTIREELGMSKSAMGFLLGPAFFWSYALAQIPTGMLVDRIGARRGLPLFSVAWSVATACFGVARGAFLLGAGRITSGLAQAGLFPGAASTVARWHPATERARASARIGAAMSVGAACGAALTGELMKYLSWRCIFALYALPGLAWAWWFYRWFRNDPAEHPQVDSSELKVISSVASEAKASDTPNNTATEAPRLPWRQLLRRWEIWLVCGQQFFRAAGYAFFASWFATYLQETRGVSTAKSGWLLTIPLLATVGGSLLGGTISDRLLRLTQSFWVARSALGATSLGVCAWLVLLSGTVADATGATLLIGCGALFAALAGPSAYAATMDLGGADVTKVFSTMNMIGNFGAGLIPWLVPTFLSWVETQPTLLSWADGNSWNALLPLFGMIYGLGAICWLGVRPKRAEPVSG